MTNVHRHNSRLSARLQPLVAEADSSALSCLLNQLSHSEFRTASYMLAEELLPAMTNPSAFMTLFFDIVPQKPKAYLGTFLKAAAKLHAKALLNLKDERLHQFSARCSDIDCRKILDSLLPVTSRREDADILLDEFAKDTEFRLNALQRAETDLCYFLLFQNLRQEEENKDLIRHHYIVLLKKDNKRAYNMASIMRHYFDLQDLPGQFSLKLQNYELSRLEISYETFTKTLNQ